MNTINEKLWIKFTFFSKFRQRPRTSSLFMLEYQMGFHLDPITKREFIDNLYFKYNSLILISEDIGRELT